MPAVPLVAREYGPETVAKSIERKILHKYQLPSENCSIFRFPKVLLPHKVNASEPVLVSIGPYHYRKEGLQAMEALKHRYLYDLLNQSRRTVQKDISLKKIVSGVYESANQAYNYYEQPIEIEREIFIEMMVIDGCFIAELLFKFVGLVEPDTTDPIFNKPCILDNIRRDLILLENQIPWFLLEHLYNDLIPLEENRFLCCDLQNHSLSFFYNMLPIKFNLPEFTLDTFQVEPNHLLDLLYCTTVYSTVVDGSMIFVSNNTDDINENPLPETWEPIPCVNALSQVGISFGKGSESNILSVEFSDGFVKIPPFIIYKHTECLFRNMVALEQSRYDYEDKIGSYLLLLDGLMKTSSDVHLLCENGIIDNWLRSEENVLKLFENLGRDVCVNNFFHARLCQNVKKYASTLKQFYPICN